MKWVLMPTDTAPLVDGDWLKTFGFFKKNQDNYLQSSGQRSVKFPSHIFALCFVSYGEAREDASRARHRHAVMSSYPLRVERKAPSSVS